MPPETRYIAVAALLIMAGAAALSAQKSPEDPVGAFGSAHNHAYLTFLVNGTKKPLTHEFLEIDPRAHFHEDDSILHIEATNVDLAYAASAINTTLNASCLSFGPDNTTYCAGAGKEIRTLINGNQVPLQTALEHDIQQGDNIIVFHGDKNAAIPDQYWDRELPDQYRATTPRQQI